MNRIFILSALASLIILIYVFYSQNESPSIQPKLSKSPKVPRIIETSKCSQGTYKKIDSNIRILDFNDLPYIDGKTSVSKVKHYDKQSIPMHNFKGQLNYHPVYIIQLALSHIDVYNTTLKQNHLDSAKKIANKLHLISKKTDSSIFFPYTFDFPLHGYTEETMAAPWYSAMAQGMALSLFSRLNEITHEDLYLDVSEKIFNSFDLSFKSKKGAPWVTCVDEEGYLWLEEYPHSPPAYTLNGMIFAIYGIYDYYRITKRNEAKILLQGAILTTRDNITKYRHKGGISQYCLRHPQVRSLKYHKVHIKQMETLYNITGDDFFLEMSKKLQSDTKDFPS